MDSNTKTIAIGGDHAGFEYKTLIKNKLEAFNNILSFIIRCKNKEGNFKNLKSFQSFNFF